MSPAATTNGVKKTPHMLLIEMERGEPIEQLLRRLYIDEDKTVIEIAQELGIAFTTVARWLRQFGIPRRQLAWVHPLEKQEPRAGLEPAEAPQRVAPLPAGGPGNGNCRADAGHAPLPLPRPSSPSRPP